MSIGQIEAACGQTQDDEASAEFESHGLISFIKVSIPSYSRIEPNIRSVGFWSKVKFL